MESNDNFALGEPVKAPSKKNRKYSFLKSEDLFRAGQWLLEHADSFEKKSLATTDIALIASKALNLDVSPANVHRIYKAVGRHIPRRQIHPVSSKNDRFELLVTTVVDLCRELGKPIPPGLLPEPGDKK